VICPKDRKTWNVPEWLLREKKIGPRLTDARAAVYREREKNGQQGREQDSPADTLGPGAQHGNDAFLDLVLMDC
jgi:hypothetical protein